MAFVAKDPLAHLALADPELAHALADSLQERPRPLSRRHICSLVDLILKCISQEISFGETVAGSLAHLAKTASPELLKRFGTMVNEAANAGPALGKLIANHSVPVLLSDDPVLFDKFQDTIDVMHKKGTHTLYEPLACISELLTTKDIAGTYAFLDLLDTTFGSDLSYGLTRHFAHALPTAAASFDTEKRPPLLRQLRRVMTADTTLVNSFLDGISRGLSLLSDRALETFVSSGLAQAMKKPAAGRNFLSLSSAVARMNLQKLRTAVPLAEARPRLQRYLRARLGSNLTINSLSELPGPLRAFRGTRPLVCTDGRGLFLADPMDLCASQTENTTLYQTLVRLESAHIEFGTFDFDFERLRKSCANLPRPKDSAAPGQTDLLRFFSLFPCPALADDLFTIFEHGRVFRLCATRYPGLVRRVMPLLKEEMRTCFDPPPKDPRQLLYAGVMVGCNETTRLFEKPPDPLQALCRHFDRASHKNAESSARLVLDAYPQMDALLDPPQRHAPFSPPFGRRIRPDLFDNRTRRLEPFVQRLQDELRRQGQKVFRADIRRQLMENGRLSNDRLSAIMAASRLSRETAPEPPPANLFHHLSERLPDLFEPSPDTRETDFDGEQVFWYHEWSEPVGDYLDRHVRLVEHQPTGQAEDMFENVLKDHSGMVQTLRRAFELLKPRELTLLRHWPDGDDIDMPALIAAVADRKAGHPPSDRIYLKRSKQIRDVAVLLLVDQSASTKNPVPGSDKSVLTVEKEAIVLFCEALEVVGDNFAVAGFSGRGRLQVDYFRYKDFDEPVARKVRRRISGMTSQRSTRTGAALRHAIGTLSKRPSKVRILILLSDGYPNDTGYKRDTAVSDVQKAVSEAKSKNIHVRPITVSISADKDLNTLYSNLHHNIIYNVRQLPDTLWRIYRALTR